MSLTKVKGFSATDVGQVRDHNEDHFITYPENGIWIVADGMGGHESGEVASELACKEIPQLVLAGSSLSEAIKQTHHSIKHAPKERNLGSPGMGTTVVAVQFKEHDFKISWVGDSRAYLYSNNELTQITRDHSFVQHLLDNGVITEEEAGRHPEKNIITQSLGSDSLAEVKVDEVVGTLFRGEKLLLCSDGLTGEVCDENILAILKAQADSEEAIKTLIKSANDNGGSDNITAILIDAYEHAPKRPARTETRKIKALTAQPSKKKHWLSAVLGMLLALVAAWLLWPNTENKSNALNTPTTVTTGSTNALQPTGLNNIEIENESIFQMDIIPANSSSNGNQQQLTVNSTDAIQIGKQRELIDKNTNTSADKPKKPLLGEEQNGTKKNNRESGDDSGDNDA